MNATALDAFEDWDQGLPKINLDNKPAFSAGPLPCPGA
jgi:hypothetical protein